MNINAAVLGATGYVGGELLRLIAAHPTFDLAAAVSSSRSGEPVTAVFPHLTASCGDVQFSKPGDWIGALERGSQLALFSAAPHAASASVIAQVMEDASKRDLDLHVVDSSADFRYGSADSFAEVYGSPHPAPELLAEFACAVPEHLSHTNSGNIGHPGCFATAILLGAMPLVATGIVDGELFVSGITGSTGSGRSPQAGTHHPERHSNLYAYKPLSHRHVPEVENLLRAGSNTNTKVNFIPHSGPFARGIYVTTQARLSATLTEMELREKLREFYADAPFVQVVNGTPRLKDVVASNYCQLGVATDGDNVVVMSAIDNLVKGAAGGAIQWMNRLWSLPETTGLTAAAPAWT